jgi:predicted nucleotidyltransferase
MNLETLKQQIIDNFKPFNPEKIILFGSAASDNWDTESDVDIIIVYETDKSFLNRLKELYQSWSIPKAVDILAYTPSEFLEMKSSNYFVQDAVKDGELIYESV